MSFVCVKHGWSHISQVCRACGDVGLPATSIGTFKFYDNKQDRIDELESKLVVAESLASEAVAKEAARWREALHAAETALIVSSPERTDYVLAKIRALLAAAPASAPCDCEAQTERYSCAKSFGHAHCPKHCGLCAPASETENKP